MSDLEKFTISRKVWLRGEGFIKSKLLRTTDNKRCCVGIWMGHMGVPDNVIADRAVLNEAPMCGKFPRQLRREFLEYHSLFESLYEDNDYGELSAADREARIIAGFAKLGYEPVFAD